MKRQKRSALTAPKVQITNQPPGKVLQVSVGVAKSRRNVGLILHKSEAIKGALFLVCDLGVMGRSPEIVRWHARILPEQLDNLIACLTVARDEADKLGLLTPRAIPKVRLA